MCDGGDGLVIDTHDDMCVCVVVMGWLLKHLMICVWWWWVDD